MKIVEITTQARALSAQTMAVLPATVERLDELAKIGREVSITLANAIACDFVAVMAIALLAMGILSPGGTPVLGVIDLKALLGGILTFFFLPLGTVLTRVWQREKKTKLEIQRDLEVFLHQPNTEDVFRYLELWGHSAQYALERMTKHR